MASEYFQERIRKKQAEIAKLSQRAAKKEEERLSGGVTAQ
jgi:hypothetical protein